MQIASIFSGALGLDLGMESAGFTTTIAVENNRHAQHTIQVNRPDITVLNNAFELTKTQLLSKGPIDAIIGGPPCQSWSYAGKQAGLEDQRGLCIPLFLDIIDSIQPQFVVMENVMGLASASINNVKGTMPNYIINRLEKSNYKVSCNEINAADYGTPQCRYRIVFLASKNQAPKLRPTHANVQQLDLFMETPVLPKWKTLKDAIWDIQNQPGEGSSYPESQLKFLKLLKEGQDWRDLPPHLKVEAMKGAIHSPGGKTGFFRRLTWNKPSPTLVCCPTQKSTCLCHPTQDRPLSIKEYARIQGFPDNWIFQGPASAQYKQIGNAVPVQLGIAIGQALLHATKTCTHL